MGKNSSYSPEAPKRPVINARRRNIPGRNLVDHVAIEIRDDKAVAAALFNSTTAQKQFLQQDEELRASVGKKQGKKLLFIDATNCVDHVGRVIAGEEGRKAHEARSASATARGTGKDVPSTTTAAPDGFNRSASDSQMLRTTGAGDDFIYLNTTTSPRKSVVYSAPIAATTSITGTQQQGLGIGLASPLKARQYTAADGSQAAVKRAADAEASANEKSAIEYYGDVGVGLGTISRKKAVAPPRESYIHPLTGQLLPSARAASASKLFDRSGMDSAQRNRIAHGDYDVPLPRSRSSIAVHKVNAGGGPGLGNSNYPSMTNLAASADGQRQQNVPQPTPRTASPYGRHAMRVSHPSEATHTRYLFGSEAVADRAIAPARKATHPLQETTFDKSLTAHEQTKLRRSAFAIEMVRPREVPTNVTSFELKDEIPTHAQLLREREERPRSRRGTLAQQYNNTTGLLDLESRQHSRGVSPPARRVGGDREDAHQQQYHSARRYSGSSQAAGGADGYKFLSSAAQSRPASAPRASSAPRPLHQMSALERRESEQRAETPTYLAGRRSRSPVVDTSRVLCPNLQPSQEPFKPHAAPAPIRNKCQAAILMDLSAQRSGRAANIDPPKPVGIRSTFSVFVAPKQPLRTPTPTQSQQSMLWGALGGSPQRATGANQMIQRQETPKGRRRVDSPARGSSLVIA